MYRLLRARVGLFQHSKQTTEYLPRFFAFKYVKTTFVSQQTQTINQTYMKSLIPSLLALGLISSNASAQLLIDFNSTTQDGGPHNEAGYQSYSAGHEVAADFTSQNFDALFSISGAATVSVTPTWNNTTDNRVQQMIDRGAANDANWVGNNINLLTDWLGTDSRTANGGNGDYDGTTGTPTFLILTLGGLPTGTYDWLGTDSRTANGGNGDYDGTTGTPTFLILTLGGLPTGTYDWLSFHHDTEHMNTRFTIEVSVDGGSTYGTASNFRMTDSTPGGTPSSGAEVTGAIDPDPHNLTSTARLSFGANGSDSVVLRFTPLANNVAANGGGVHQTFFGINGFELVQVPEPSSIALMLIAGAGGLLFFRRKK